MSRTILPTPEFADVIITAYVKRQNRLPLSQREAAGLLQAKGIVGCSYENLQRIEKRAKAKIRSALEETMFARGTKENTPVE